MPCFTQQQQVAAARHSPHGTLDQSHLVRWGGDEHPGLLVGGRNVTNGLQAVHLVGQTVLVALHLIRGLLHLDGVAETQGAQEQLLFLLMNNKQESINLMAHNYPKHCQENNIFGPLFSTFIQKCTFFWLPFRIEGLPTGTADEITGI